MLFSLTEVSGNRKTGKIAVSKASSDTCPPSCKMWFDCYAKFHYLKGHWDRLDRGEGSAVGFQEYLSQVRKKASGIWRCNEAGDLPGKHNKIDKQMLEALVKASRGTQPFAYTHKPVTPGNYRVKGPNGQVKKGKISEQLAENNREAIRKANQNGFTINLSCDSLDEVDEKVSLKIAPVVTVLPLSDENKASLYTPQDNKVVVCPAQRFDDITCKTCKLCAIKDRKSIVGFVAHSAAKHRITRRLEVLNNSC